jgi:excisionase family DNA binding protein
MSGHESSVAALVPTGAGARTKTSQLARSVPRTMTDSNNDIHRLTTPLLTAAEAAELLAVRPSWVYEAVRVGNLPCVRIGRHIRFTRPMLEDWLRGRVA